MSEFVELEALPSVTVNSVTIEVDRDCRYLIAVDVTGLDRGAARAKCLRAGEVFGRVLGQRVIVMEERNGVPEARVFELQAEPRES